MKEGGNYQLINGVWEAKIKVLSPSFCLGKVAIGLPLRVLVQDLTGKLLQFSERVERFVVTE